MRRLAVLCVVTDAFTTAYGLTHHAAEMNPLVAWLIGTVGLMLALLIVSAVKMTAVVAIVGVRTYAVRDEDRYARLGGTLIGHMMLLVLVAYSVMVLNNLWRIA